MPASPLGVVMHARGPIAARQARRSEAVDSDYLRVSCFTLRLLDLFSKTCVALETKAHLSCAPRIVLTAICVPWARPIRLAL